MVHPKKIVTQDKRISEFIDAGRANAASDLFEYYRILGENREAFVAALIARLCVLEARHRLDGMTS